MNEKIRCENKMGGWMGVKAVRKFCCKKVQSWVGGWMDGWEDGWMDECKNRFKDCLLQSKTFEKSQIFEIFHSNLEQLTSTSP